MCGLQLLIFTVLMSVIWEEIFFSQLQMLTVVYTTFFPNDETQILFLDSDDIPLIPYHGRELTNRLPVFYPLCPG